MGFARAGFVVEGICPSRHPLANTSVVGKVHAYHSLSPVRSFAEAIASAKPDLVVPSDDLAARHLHHLHQRERKRGEAGAQTCELIERSLGASESFGVVYARAEFMRLAHDEGVLAPETEVVADVNQLRRWIVKTGLPIVLKANGTSGGDGVRIVHALDDAEKAFRSLQAPPLLVRAAKRAILDQDKTLVWPSLVRHRSTVNAQAFVAGRETTSTVACWNGSVLAALHFEVLQKKHDAGPATVMRLIEDEDMSTAVVRMTRRLMLSGIHGFDFMRDTENGRAHLIEINPRATQVGHLTLGAGRDLPAALYAAVTGETVRPAPKVTEKEIIALFPQEWMRDPQSAFLSSGHHDVPWEEPGLIRACVRHGKASWAFSPKKSTSTSRLPIHRCTADASGLPGLSAEKTE